MEKFDLSGSVMLYRLRVPCYRVAQEWQAGGIELDESFRLPAVASLVGLPDFADVRVGWHARGLAIDLRVDKKSKSPHFRPGDIAGADGIHLWIDTRDTHTVHRATRFCHWIVMLPRSSPSNEKPVASMLRINRAKEEPRTINQHPISVHSAIREDGYRLSGWIPGQALTGWDPSDHRYLGFCYAVHDRDFGLQTFAASAELPYREDPSLWHTLQLVDS